MWKASKWHERRASVRSFIALTGAFVVPKSAGEPLRGTLGLRA